jgi:hypothetical protein
MSEIEVKLREVAVSFSNVTYLQKDAKVIGNTVFLGCTLWTDFTKEQDGLAIEGINDYHSMYVNTLIEPLFPYKYTRFGVNTHNSKRTQYGKRFLQPADIRKIHGGMIEWLNDKLEYYTQLGHDIVVLSHHAPSKKMLSYTDELSIFYASNLDELMVKHRVKAWLSGHTHDVITTSVGDTLVASNCLGYVGKENPLFNVKANIEFI